MKEFERLLDMWIRFRKWELRVSLIWATCTTFVALWALGLLKNINW